MSLSSVENGCLVRQFGGDEKTSNLLNRLHFYGFARYSILSRAGVVYEANIVRPVRETTYTLAMDEVKTEEDAGKLPAGSTDQVLSLILDGKFDDSDWALWYGTKQATDNTLDK